MFVTGTVLINNEEKNINEEKGIATARAINFFNDLFDSTNSCEVKDDSCELRCPVIENSVHHAFWVSAKETLGNMIFVEKKSMKRVNKVRSIKN